MCLGTKCVLQIPADVSVVWGDRVTLTTKNIPVFGLVPESLCILQTSLFFVRSAPILSCTLCKLDITNCPSRTTKRSPSRKMDDRLPHHMCTTFACQTLTPLYFPLKQFSILQLSFRSAECSDPN